MHVQPADYQDDVDANLSEADEEQEDEITRIFTQKKRKRADKCAPLGCHRLRQRLHWRRTGTVA